MYCLNDFDFVSFEVWLAVVVCQLGVQVWHLAHPLLYLLDQFLRLSENSWGFPVALSFVEGGHQMTVGKTFSEHTQLRIFKGDEGWILPENMEV